MRTLLAALLCFGASDPERPNILLLIADDWSWEDAGAYGHPSIKTPTFDQLAREGVLFRNAYCASPSCTPSRAAILMGRPVQQLGATGNLWSAWPPEFTPYPDLLEASGYVVGLRGKGWGPGEKRARNPAGPSFKDFPAFLKSVPEGKPFCFWFGSGDPHRPYDKDAAAKSRLAPEAAVVPPFFPDAPDVRKDLLDYYFEVQRFDQACGEILAALEASGRAENTIVVMTSDNGRPFPRCKANVYDAGARMPLVVRWPSKVKAGRRTDAFASLSDLAPTFLEAAGVERPSGMSARSLLPLVVDGIDAGRDRVFIGRERHANVRKGDLSYPVRAIRTKDFLYVRNFRPERWPAGDPEKHAAVGPFGDCDGGPTKSLMLSRRDDPLFALAFGKRPEEELYDVAKDPHQMSNVAADAVYAGTRARLRAELDAWLKESGDVRITDPSADPWDAYEYFGSR